MARKNPLKTYIIHGKQAALPPRDISGSREVSNETTLLHTSPREDIYPAPSVCNNSAISDVTSTNPSRIFNVTSSVVNANPDHTTTSDIVCTNTSYIVNVTGGIVNTNPGHGAAGDVASSNTSRIVHATSDVVNVNPGHSVTGNGVCNIPSRTLNVTGDVVNANPGHTNIGDDVVNTNPPVDPPSKPQSKPIRVTRLAPNRLVNWNNLQSVVIQNMGACRTCYSKRLMREEITSCSYATTLELICGEFNHKSEKNMLEVSYLTKKGCKYEVKHKTRKI